MIKSVFKISKMDCPSEEQLIRMKLGEIDMIKQLSFNLSERELIVIHSNDVQKISNQLNELNLGSLLLYSDDFDGELQAENSERGTLWIVLLINFTFFVVEMLYGYFSNSMGLIADSLDMLADSFVYGLSLMAVGQAVVKKKKVAKWSGYFQIFLGILGLAEVLRRFVGTEEIPVFQNMIVVSLLALIANAVSLYLIQKIKSKDAHIQASTIFTSNDIVINLGVIIAGVLVYFTGSIYPDLIVGLVIFLIVIRGTFRILNLSK